VKILLDHCVPKRFRLHLPGCEVKTTFQMGWADLDNGELLATAAVEFDAFISVDKNIPHQQNIPALPMTVVILVAPNSELATLIPFAPLLLQTLSTTHAISLVRIHQDGHVETITREREA
jgi:hypothetical protein